jgi:trimeric autotransporter adhesin
MSTKTTIKRIALVAVAALGFGVVSVAPSSATVISDSISLSASTTTIVTGSTASVTLTTAGYFATTDSITSTAALKTYPAGATAAQIGTAISTIAFSAIDTATAYTGGSAGGSIQTASGGTVVVGVEGGAAKLVSTRTKLSVAPTLVGTYTYTITPTIAANGAVSATAQTWTVIVTAKAKATAASVGNTAGSTLVYGAAWNYGTTNSMGGTYADPDATNTAALVTAGGVTCYSPLGFGNPCLVGRIVLSNGVTTAGAGLTAAEAEALTYKVTGPGVVALNKSDANWTGALPAGGTGETTETTANGGVGTPESLTKTFLLFTTGAPGKITLTISSGTTVIATVSATAFGDVKTITPTVVNNPIVVSTTANAGTITALVKDQEGTLVRGATVYAVSDTVGVISNSYTSCGTTTATGLVTCNLVGVAAGTANITLTTNASATATGGVSSAPVAVRVSDGVATKVDYKFAKDSYAPGETATITATVSNAAGVLPAGTYTVLATGGVTANYGITGLPSTTVLAVGNTGTATYTVTIPTGITGDVQLAGTSSATTIAATFGKATIVNAAQDAANAATDAAAEAIDAANAATDAANAAAEAADAATAAAQDAADAVAALSVSVAAMIDALKKQITSLTNLVIKIQKKVKA